MERRSKISNGKTKYLNSLSARIEFTDDTKKEILNLSAFKNMSEAQNGIVRLPRSTLLIGDKLYNNVWHPADDAAKSYMTMDHQPLITDHEDHLADEVGWMDDVEYDPESKKLSAIPVLNLNTEKGPMALNHIRNRLMAGKAPETSVGFWATEQIEQIEQLQNAEHTVAHDWEFDHNSLVTRGAGSPEMGIGIGLSRSKTDQSFNINFNQLGDKERMGNEQPIEKPKPEPEKFTMSKEEFHDRMMSELATQETAQKQKLAAQPAGQPADKTTELDALKTKLADAEAKLATRTTATRDNLVTDGMPGAPSKPTSPKTKVIRQQLVGMALIKHLKQSPDECIHICYENEQNLPPGAR